MPKITDWTSILIQEAPQGVVCIRKPRSVHHRDGDVVFWQFPGGKNDPGENPEQTAVRENLEETGIAVERSTLCLVNSEIQYNHHTHRPFILHLFCTKISAAQAESRLDVSKEGEEVQIYPWSKLRRMEDFSPLHRHLAVKFRIWK